LLFGKRYEVVPFILLFDLFLFYAKIETICKVKRGKNELILVLTFFLLFSASGLVLDFFYPAKVEQAQVKEVFK